MKFSTVAAVSAAIFGGVALANPGSVIYETKVVTITSCAPEVTSCTAGKTQTSYIPVPTTSVHLTTTRATTPCPTGTGAVPTGTGSPKPKPVCPGSPECPPIGKPKPVCPGSPECPPIGKPEKPTFPILPTGTGVPQPPKNTSVPVVPSPKPTAPVSPGAGSKMGVSILAVAGAAVFALLA